MKAKWSRERHPSRERDRFLLRMAEPRKKGERRRLGQPRLIEIKNGKMHFVLTKQVEFLSIASPFRPDLGDCWKPEEK